MKLKLPEYEDWSASALCSGQAPLYEVPERPNGSSKYGSEMKWEYQQRANLCWDCPVMLQCLESATDEDKWWTIRGGELPGVMAQQKTVFPFPVRETSTGVLIRTCRNGHPYDTTPRYTDARGSHCGACRDEKTKRTTAAKAQERLKARQGKGLALSDEWLQKGVCPAGHDIDGASLLNRYGQCRACQAEEAREKKRAGERRRGQRKRDERRAHIGSIIREAAAIALVHENLSPDASLIQHAHDMGAMPTQVPS